MGGIFVWHEAVIFQVSWPIRTHNWHYKQNEVVSHDTCPLRQQMTPFLSVSNHQQKSLVAKVQRREMPDMGMLFLNIKVRRSNLISDSLNEVSDH